METKICCVCNKKKPLSDFKNRSDSKDGKRNNCIKCYKDYQINYYESNKEINKDKRKEQTKIYRNNNKDKINQLRINYKPKRNLNHRERFKTDELYRINCNLRAMVHKSFRSKNHIKKSKTIDILGLKIDDFKLYLESKFEPWMSWNNYGLYNGCPNYGWDIDHIKPLKTATSEEDVIELNHYTNLQPLCSYVNRNIKRDN